jgi:serine protease inhibitor
MAVAGQKWSRDRHEHRGFQYDDDDFHDRYDRFGSSFGGFGSRDSNVKSQCPKLSKAQEFCIPIPASSREEFSTDQAIAEFSWKLFQAANTQEDFALSPLSPQILLTYLAWAANGTTKSELESLVKFTNPRSIERIVSNLKQDILNRKGNPQKELDIATAFFIANDLK